MVLSSFQNSEDIIDNFQPYMIFIHKFHCGKGVTKADMRNPNVRVGRAGHYYMTNGLCPKGCGRRDD